MISSKNVQFEIKKINAKITLLPFNILYNTYWYINLSEHLCASTSIKQCNILWCGDYHCTCTNVYQYTKLLFGTHFG